MTDKVLITDVKTGAVQVKTLDFWLPLYEIGDTVGFQSQSEKDAMGPKTYIEADVTRIEMSVQTDKDGGVYAICMYELEDGSVVMEEEIEYYWAGGKDADDEDIPEEDEIIDPIGVKDDERDPISGSDSGAV